MNIRKVTLTTLLGAAVVLAVGSRSVPTRSAAPTGARAAQEARTSIVLPSAAREAVLSEMRAMLRALHGVLNAMERGDRSAMRDAAAGGGMAIAVDTDPSVQERLPAAFMELGMSTHRAFDELAAAVEAGAGRDSLITHLSALTSKCVACHASYRIDTP